MVDDDDSVTAAMQVGAQGYLLKGAVQEEVLGRLRHRWPPAARSSGQERPAVSLAEEWTARYAASLTERGPEVLALIADGRSQPPSRPRARGQTLKTVQNHVSHVLAKLQVRDRTQAALRMRGLVGR